MPAKDKYHQRIKNALIKDGWTITHDPFAIKYAGMTVFADLGAERLIAAERGTQKIVVEIKSFLKRSLVQDLKETLGQYVLYCGFLEQIDPERRLYMGISEEVYEDFFQQKAVRLLIQRTQMPLLVVDIDREEIVSWTK